MIPVDQAVHGPTGNCLAACVASLLELPIEAVPNFMDGLPSWDPDDAAARLAWSRAFFSGVNAWLAPMGLAYFEVGNSVTGLPEHLWDAVSRAGYWIGVGGVEGGGAHAVVMLAGEMVHDPHPSRSGLPRIDAIGLLVPLDPAAWRRS